MRYIEPCPCCGKREQWKCNNVACASQTRIQCSCGLCSPWVGFKKDPWDEWNRLAEQCSVGRDTMESFQ